jgi:hypothetical protein
MITFIRTAQILPGKIGDAVPWGKEIAAMVKRITGIDVVVCHAVGGAVGELAWIAQYDNLGQVEQAMGKIMADREYIAAVSKAEHLLTPGSARDHFWRHL